MRIERETKEDAAKAASGTTGGKAKLVYNGWEPVWVVSTHRTDCNCGMCPVMCDDGYYR